jgi:drug/metabolite transporter (DMT)-like permease
MPQSSGDSLGRHTGPPLHRACPRSTIIARGIHASVTWAPTHKEDPADVTIAGSDLRHRAERASARASWGYAMVVAGYLLVALSGTLVALTTAPPSVLIVLRFAIAFTLLTAVFAPRRRLLGLLVHAGRKRLLLMGAVDAATLLLYFIAVRETGVAVATFLYFMQPLWVAILAPRFLGSETERTVWVAIGMALAGLVLILAPSVAGGEPVSWAGMAAGLTCGLLYACFALLVKGLSKSIDSVSLVIAQSALDTVFLLPLALWQTLVIGYALTQRDLLAAVVLGVVCTAIAYTLWMEGTHRIRMQHSAVLGFLTPVAAPFFALGLAGQAITGWTLAGGALILGSGVLVALRGRIDIGEEPPL